jgi:uncharacterized protein YodC (DUF2158 family)
MEIRAGDVVVLKSGGPDMTVESVEGLQARCAWFLNGELKRGSFPLSALEKT